MWYQTEGSVEWPPLNGFAVHVDHDWFIHFETERESFLFYSDRVTRATEGAPYPLLVI
jgi:hypothetical protein